MLKAVVSYTEELAREQATTADSLLRQGTYLGQHLETFIMFASVVCLQLLIVTLVKPPEDFWFYVLTAALRKLLLKSTSNGSYMIMSASVLMCFLITGPLHGIPYGLKDVFAVPGYKTTWGSVSYKDQVIDEESWVYQK